MRGKKFSFSSTRLSSFWARSIHPNVMDVKQNDGFRKVDPKI